MNPINMAAGFIPGLPGMLVNVIGAAVGEAVKRVAADPTKPLLPAEAPVVSREVTRQVVEQIKTDPMIRDLTARIEHVTSTEAWYQSRANWSAIVAGLTPVIAATGYNLAPDDQVFVATALALVGNAIAAYLARRARTAKKPLGA